MAALRRIAVAVLMLTFLMGLTAQSVTRASMAVASERGTLVTGTMPDGSADHKNPCTDSAPCAVHPGCVALAALAPTPGSTPIPVSWALVEYRELALPLAGHSVEPELSPPILPA